MRPSRGATVGRPWTSDREHKGQLNGGVNGVDVRMRMRVAREPLRVCTGVTPQIHKGGRQVEGVCVGH